MSANPIAVFTFFSKTTCGHCKTFKGESTNSSGVTKIDPNSGWETLTSDLELQKMGIKFNLYQFGPEQDSKTGIVKNYVLEEPYASRISGVPHLELSLPGKSDKDSVVAFEDPKLRGWGANDSVPLIKSWIIRTVQTPLFKVRVSQPAQPIRQNREFSVSRPIVPARISNDTTNMPAIKPNQAEFNLPPPVHVAPTTVGMETSRVPIPLQSTNTIVEKSKPKFLPSNYDQ